MGSALQPLLIYYLDNQVQSLKKVIKPVDEILVLVALYEALKFDSINNLWVYSSKYLLGVVSERRVRE